MHLPFAALLRSLFTPFIIFVIFLSVLFSSCDSNKQSSDTKKTSNDSAAAGKLAPFATNYLNGFALPKATFDSIVRIPGMTSSNAVMVLRFFTRDLWKSDMKFEIMGHSARNHSLDSIDVTNPIKFEIIDSIQLPTAGDSLYVFGNSEVSLKRMDRMLRGITDTSQVKYFFFVPKRGGKTKNIVFKVYPVTASGKKADRFVEGDLYSNPSPPKKPVTEASNYSLSDL